MTAPAPECRDRGARVTARRQTGPRVLGCRPLALEARVAQRFNAYARAAHPYEIGGLLRIVADPGKGCWRAIDLLVPPQRVERGCFELDPPALARWQLELEQSGQGEQIPQWRGIVHSHPRLPAFLSPEDLATLVEFAGARFAFSLI